MYLCDKLCNYIQAPLAASTNLSPPPPPRSSRHPADPDRLLPPTTEQLMCRCAFQSTAPRRPRRAWPRMAGRAGPACHCDCWQPWPSTVGVIHHHGVQSLSLIPRDATHCCDGTGRQCTAVRDAVRCAVQRKAAAEPREKPFISCNIRKC